MVAAFPVPAPTPVVAPAVPVLVTWAAAQSEAASSNVVARNMRILVSNMVLLIR
jgi:hypothetical protein